MHPEWAAAKPKLPGVPYAEGSLVKVPGVDENEPSILMGRHKSRTDLGIEFGATDIVAERGEDGIAKVRELAGGHGVRKVLEAVRHLPAYEQAYGIVRPAGIVSRVDVPQCEEAPVGFGSLSAVNITLTGGPAPVRSYVEQRMPPILDATMNPAKSSTAPSVSTRSRTPTAPWTTAKP